MTSYVIRRLLLLPLILFGVSLLIFIMISLLSPAQRAALFVPDVPKRPGELERLIERYGLNDPMPQQYVRWLGQVARGNLGYSKTGKEPVALMIRNRFPATLELALWAAIPILVIGIRLGIAAARRHNQSADHGLRIFSILGTSMPTFVLGLLLLMVFAAQLGWLPTGDRLSPEAQRLVDSDQWHGVTRLITVDSLLNRRLDVFVDAVRHLILPVLTLSVVSWAVLLRVTRSSMLESLRQDYIRAARAKGLSESAVVQRHARPNAMLPVATLGGLIIIGLLNGVAITESIFNYPGIGQRFVDAATNLDVVTVLGLVLFSGTILILGNLVVDVLYVYLDPRVRLS